HYTHCTIATRSGKIATYAVVDALRPVFLPPLRIANGGGLSLRAIFWCHVFGATTDVLLKLDARDRKGPFIGIPIPRQPNLAGSNVRGIRDYGADFGWPFASWGVQN